MMLREFKMQQGLLPVRPLPVRPLPVHPLPVRPLPVCPLPVRPLPVRPGVWACSRRSYGHVK